jgi:hypothetical protein
VIPHQSLKSFLIASLVPSLWSTAVRAEECAVLYEHPHLGGASWVIEAETQSSNVSDAMIERRKWCGSLRGYCKGRDRSWNDSVSSIQVNPGCALMAWVDHEFSGSKFQFSAVSETNVYGSLPINDQITSFRCSCSVPPDSSNATVSYYFGLADEFSEAEAP